MNSTPTLLTPADGRTLEQTLAHTVGRERGDASHTISAKPAAGADHLAAAPVVLKRLGYDLGKELGRGGLGAVHLAQQQAFDRAVAIKRLLVQDDRLTGMKFYAEAVVTASLEHPNIVPVYDLLSDQQGRLQLVMKRVEGRTWKRMLHPEPGDAPETLTLDDHLDILVKVAEAVSFAHDRGILHRDLKPENVMVGGHGEVLLMDWGCAVAFGSRESHPVVPRIEEVDQVAGTPAYMAPEMVLVEQHAIGPHSDVFLLGAMLYEVLTGCRPHQGDSVMSVLRAAAMDDVVAPRLRAPERDIPAELEDVCLAALVREPSRRIATAAAFLERLRAYRRHAQAVTLARLAERLLDEAGRLGGDARTQARADDGLRRAVAAAENACELWLGWPAGSAVAARATITHARHCLATGGATQAESLAQRAAPHARAAGDERAVGQAKSLAEQARRQGQAARQRERTLRITRWATLGLAALIVAGSLAATVMISAKQHEAESARARAESALADLSREQAQRHADQRKYAPGLVAQAKAAITSERLADAAEALGGALAFDAESVEAMMLQANVLAALGRYAEALPLAQRWQSLAAQDANAKELSGLCALAASQDQKLVATRCADLFMREHLPTLAQAGLRSNGARLIAYQARIEQIAPGSGGALEIDDAGELAFPYGAPGLSHRPTLVDLSPLRGMPFHELNLAGSGVVDLSPLADMPLTELNLSDTKVRDLSPLRRCPLQSLFANGTAIDLSTLAGFKLVKLWAYGNAQITRLDALRGMPLVDLHLAGARIEDLAPLSGSRLAHLIVEGSFTSLEPLRGLPLVDAWLMGGYPTLAPLAGCPLRALTLRSSVPIDPAGLPAEQLESLALEGCRFTATRSLASVHPVDVRLSDYSDGQTADLGPMDLSRVTSLGLTHCSNLSLVPFVRSPLRSLDIDTSWQIDCAVLAKAPLTVLSVAGIDAATWRSLAALRTNATLAQIRRDNHTTPAAAFWAAYDPDLLLASAAISAPVDDGAPRPADQPRATAPGLAYEACLGSWSSVKELAQAAVNTTGVAPLPDVGLLPQPENAGLRFAGFVEVPKDGLYRFDLVCDDGGVLRIGERVVADNDGLHAAVDVPGAIRLKAGKHALSLLYFNALKDGVLRLNVSGPDHPSAPIPASWLSHAAAAP